MSDGRSPLPLTCRKLFRRRRNQGRAVALGRSLGETRLLPRWRPAYRQHEPGPGSRTEHVKARPDTAAGKGRREGELQAAESARS